MWTSRGDPCEPLATPHLPPLDVWEAVVEGAGQARHGVWSSLGLTGSPSRFVGLLVVDHCPIPGIQVLSPFASVRPLGPLDPEPWETMVSNAVGMTGLLTFMGDRAEYHAAHPCGVLQVELPPVTSIAQARTLFEFAGQHWLLALVLRFGATFEPIADVVVDRARNDVDMRFFTGFAHAHLIHMNATSHYIRRVMPNLLREPKMRLFVVLLRDFLGEPEDSPAILKGWLLLEVMASEEPGTKKEPKVRSLCDRLNLVPDAVHLAGKYAPGDDLLAAAYRHRNCIAHEGHCNPQNCRCDEENARSPCGMARPLRLDLQLFLFGLVADYLGATTAAAFGPEGVQLVDTPGLFDRAAGLPNTQPHH